MVRIVAESTFQGLGEAASTIRTFLMFEFNENELSLPMLARLENVVFFPDMAESP
jgi:hypothetical protein